MYPKITRGDLDALLATRLVKEVDLTAMDVRSPPVDFSGVTIDSSTIQAMDLSGLRFANATLLDCWCSNTNFTNADFTGAKLVGSWNANFSGAKLHDASLKKVSFEFATLTGTDFTNADLEKADFTDAELAGACFRGATSPARISGRPRSRGGRGPLQSSERIKVESAAARCRRRRDLAYRK